MNWVARIDDPEFCCSWGCGGGACETCPCCCAGWCIGGRDGIPGTPECEPDADPEQVAYFWEMAGEHNPLAREVIKLRFDAVAGAL